MVPVMAKMGSMVVKKMRYGVGIVVAMVKLEVFRVVRLLDASVVLVLCLLGKCEIGRLA